MLKKLLSLPRKYESIDVDTDITGDLVTETLKENVKILEITFPCQLSCYSYENQFEIRQQVDQTSYGLFILNEELIN